MGPIPNLSVLCGQSQPRKVKGDARVRRSGAQAPSYPTRAHHGIPKLLHPYTLSELIIPIMDRAITEER
jgi:hypothetical protein